MPRDLRDAVHAAAGRHHAAARRVGREVMAARGAEARALAPAADPDRPNAAARRGASAGAPTHPLRGSGPAARGERLARRHLPAAIAQRSVPKGGIGEGRCRGADRKPPRGRLRAGGIPSWRRPRRGGTLDPHRDRLKRRWAEGRRNAARLWREPATVDFPGRPSTARARATRRRGAEPDLSRPLRTAGDRPWRPPSGRRVARPPMADADTPPDAGRAFAAAVTVAERLALVPRERGAEALGDVLAAAGAMPLAPFVAEPREDTAGSGEAFASPMQAASDTPRVTSPAEGQINRAEAIKRSMYGGLPASGERPFVRFEGDRWAMPRAAPNRQTPTRVPSPPPRRLLSWSKTPWTNHNRAAVLMVKKE